MDRLSQITLEDGRLRESLGPTTTSELTKNRRAAMLSTGRDNDTVPSVVYPLIWKDKSPLCKEDKGRMTALFRSYYTWIHDTHPPPPLFQHVKLNVSIDNLMEGISHIGKCIRFLYISISIRV